MTQDNGRGSMIIAAAIILSALGLGWALDDDDSRYELAGSGSSVVRMDRETGEMIACDTSGCKLIQDADKVASFGPLSVRIGGEPDEATRVERNVRQQVRREVDRQVERSVEVATNSN